MKVLARFGCFFILLFFCTNQLQSQSIENTGMTDRGDSSELGKIQISGYVDSYFAYNLNQPASGDRVMAVSSSRDREITVNLAYIDIRYQTQNVRARFVPGAGTYLNANYAQEKGSLQNIIEAYAGIRLSKKKAVWLDAGVLGSPITNESAISKDHLMYSRSLAAEHVPYYLSGLRLTYPLTEKLNSYLYIVNGWQQIHNQNKYLSAIAQLEYKASDQLLFNWNVYAGDESTALTPNDGNRYFSDVYLLFNPAGKLSMTACVFVGIQERKIILGNQSYTDKLNWSQGNLTARYRFNKTYSLSGRIESFSDDHFVMLKPGNIPTKRNSNNPIATLNSAGLCFDMKIGTHALFRIEGRHFYAEDPIFLSPHSLPLKTEQLILSNLTVWF